MMKGLLIKDILGLRKYFFSCVVICFFFLILSVLVKTAMFVSSILSVLFLLMPLTVFSYDESAKWDAYGLTLPVTRKQMVFSRYVLTLLMLVVGSLIGSVLTYGITQLPGVEETSQEMLAVIPVICGLGLIILSVVFPLIYQFGAEKGRYIMIAVFLLFMIVMFLFNQLPGWQEKVLPLLVFLPYIAPAAGIIFLVISYFISCRIYENKEF